MCHPLAHAGRAQVQAAHPASKNTAVQEKDTSARPGRDAGTQLTGGSAQLRFHIPSALQQPGAHDPCEAAARPACLPAARQ